jgi:MFS family permease
MAMAAQAAIFLAAYVLAPAFRDELGLTVPQMGMLFAAPWVGSMATALAWGMASDRWGERRTGSLGLLGGALGLVLAAYARSFEALLVGFVLAGAFGGAVNSATGTAIVRWYGPRERGFAMGIRFLAVPLAGVGVSAVVPPLLDAGGPRLALLALAGYAVLSAAAIAAAVSRGPHVGVVTVGSPVGHPLRDARVWRLATAAALLGAAQAAVTGFVVAFLEGERDFTLREAAAVLAGMNVLAAFGRLWTGWLSDRRGRRAPIVRAIAAAVAASLGAVAMFAYSAPLVVATLFIVAGGLSMSPNALLFTVTTERGGVRPGAAAGLLQTLVVISAAATPVLFAALVELTSWRIAFGAVAGAALLGLLLIRPSRDPREAAAAG